jgi:hypothetical protein
LKGRTQNDATYLERDADTVALLGENSKNEDAIPESKLRFGWQLRPMAGRRSVTAGLRQMFAVLALPQKDETDKDKLSLNVEVRTYWRRFNAKTGTSSDRLNLKAWISNRPVELHHKWNQKFEVTSTVKVEGGLRPYLENVSWQAVGPNRAVIMVKGRNFFPGTSVMLGDQNYRTDDGLIIKSEKTLQVTVPLVALMSDAVLNGRYGPSLPLYFPPAGLPGLTLSSVSLSDPTNTRVTEMRFEFSLSAAMTPLEESKFMDLPDPLLQLNGQLITTPLIFSPIKSGNEVKRVDCVALVPSELVPEGNCSIVLKFPMFGPQWTFRYQIYSPSRRELTVTRIQKSGKPSLLIRGTRFVPHEDASCNGVSTNAQEIPANPKEVDKNGTMDWKIRLDKEYIVSKEGELRRLSSNVLELSVPDSVLKENDTLVVSPPGGQAAFVLSVPDAPHGNRIAMVGLAEVLLVAASPAATRVKITGAYLDSIVRAKFDNSEVSFAAAVGGQSLMVELEAGMAATAGSHQLALLDADGQEYRVSLLVTTAQL